MATVYPVIGKEPSILVDTGANAECKPNNLFEFATMGSIYMEKVIGRENPSVGLVNNGTEEGKGTTLTKAAYELIDKSDLNFIGSVEARNFPNGACDVIVTDGFTGNAIIKLTEGMGLMVLREMKRRFLSNTKSKLGAMLLKDQLSGIKKNSTMQSTAVRRFWESRAPCSRCTDLPTHWQSSRRLSKRFRMLKETSLIPYKIQF